MSDQVLRLKPNEYVHVHDNQANVTELLTGPATVTIQTHQTLLQKQPQAFVVIPPQSYAVVENPVLRDANGGILKDKHGQVRVNLGEKEIRFFQAPFPLFPQEVVAEQKSLRTLEATQALLVRANRNFVDEDMIERSAGDEWLIRGPITHVPRIEVDVVERRDAVIVKFNESLKLRAKNKHKDQTGVNREVGEEYLWSKEGAYLVGVDETLVAVVPATVLTRTSAIHVEVLKAFHDSRPWANRVRKPGEFYLLTNEQTAEFTPFPTEKIVKTIGLTAISNCQWAVILDPVNDQGVPQLGRRKVVTNTTFFLQPGERLESGVRSTYVLSEDEALLLSATEEFEDIEDGKPIKRTPGELWLIRGPCEYIPHSSVKINKDKNGEEKRRKIVLSETEGVYVRNTLTGEIRSVIGGTYMLSAVEELWEKELSPVIEEKLARQGKSHCSYIEKLDFAMQKRDKTRVISFHVPHNSVAQVYDYKKRSQRIIFGPDAVLLGPEEEFTVLSLSGSDWDPKRPNICLPKQTGKIKALYLYLGHSSMSDNLQVETADHARLELQLSYDFQFDVEFRNEQQANEAFNQPDFVGDCCSCIASRVRASVASVPFDAFHKGSSSIVRRAVFGVDEEQNVRSSLRFKANRLVVTSVDIQAMEVLDQKTRIALQESVKMAIEVTTQSQEAAARQEASVREQQARGRLERQQIEDKAANEIKRKALLECETKTNAIATTGSAKAVAEARGKAGEIEGDNAVEVAKIKAKTAKAMESMTMAIKKKRQDQELSYKATSNGLELSYSKELANIESQKFNRTMEAVGKDTVVALARAGPEAQQKLLKAMGLQGYLVTDGTNPINLFNAAKGMTGQAAAADK